MTPGQTQRPAEGVHGTTPVQNHEQQGGQRQRNGNDDDGVDDVADDPEHGVELAGHPNQNDLEHHDTQLHQQEG